MAGDETDILQEDYIYHHATEVLYKGFQLLNMWLTHAAALLLTTRSSWLLLCSLPRCTNFGEQPVTMELKGLIEFVITMLSYHSSISQN